MKKIKLVNKLTPLQLNCRELHLKDKLKIIFALFFAKRLVLLLGDAK